MFSTRTNWQLEANTITRRLNELKKAGTPFIDLTESNPTRCGFNYPEAITLALSNPNNIHYDPDPQGSRAVRELIAQDYKDKGCDVKADQIILTAGTSEAYAFLFRLLANPQDNILIPRPSYPLFEFLIQLNDLHPKLYPLLYRDGWSIDLRKIESLINPDTKAIVIVNPNNPTGNYLKEKEHEAISRLASDNNLALISDEVFYDYSFGQSTNRVSLAKSSEGLNFTLDGLSKAIALPQMKLSWIVMTGEENLIERARERLLVIADTFLSVNTPTQNAFKTWLEHKATIQQQVKDRIINNRETVTQMAHDAGLEVLAAEGGWYSIVSLPEGKSEEEWVLSFIDECQTYVQPGFFFDFYDEGYMVLSLLPEEGVLKEGLTKILAQIPS